MKFVISDLSICLTIDNQKKGIMVTSTSARISRRTRRLVEGVESASSSSKRIREISSGKRVVRVEMYYSTQSQ